MLRVCVRAFSHVISYISYRLLETSQSLLSLSSPCLHIPIQSIAQYSMIILIVLFLKPIKALVFFSFGNSDSAGGILQLVMDVNLILYHTEQFHQKKKILAWHLVLHTFKTRNWHYTDEGSLIHQTSNVYLNFSQCSNNLLQISLIRDRIELSPRSSV